MPSQPVVVDPNAPEVRWCSSCHHTAVVHARDWQQEVWGTATGDVVRDYRCQHCGKKYRIRPRLQTTLMLVVGVMAATTIVGLPFFFLFWRRHTVPKRIPPVAGAPMPPIRFHDGPPLRQCAACLVRAMPDRVVRSTHNGIPSGAETTYRCPSCRGEFTIHGPWSIVLDTLIGLSFVAAGAAFLAWAEAAAWRWGGSIVCGLLALLLLSGSVSRVRARRRHPVMPPAAS